MMVMVMMMVIIMSSPEQTNSTLGLPVSTTGTVSSSRGCAHRHVAAPHRGFPFVFLVVSEAKYLFMSSYLLPTTWLQSIALNTHGQLYKISSQDLTYHFTLGDLVRNMLILLAFPLQCVYDDPEVTGTSYILYLRSSVCPFLFSLFNSLQLFIFNKLWRMKFPFFLSFNKVNQSSQHYRSPVP